MGKSSIIIIVDTKEIIEMQERLKQWNKSIDFCSWI